MEKEKILDNEKLSTILIYLEDGFRMDMFGKVAKCLEIEDDYLNYLRLTKKYKGLFAMKNILSSNLCGDYFGEVTPIASDILDYLNDDNFMDAISSLIILTNLNNSNLNLDGYDIENKAIDLIFPNHKPFLNSTINDKLHDNIVSLYYVCKDLYDKIFLDYFEIIYKHKELNLSDIKSIYYGTLDEGDKYINELPYHKNKITNLKNIEKIVGEFLYNAVVSKALEKCVIKRYLKSLGNEVKGEDSMNIIDNKKETFQINHELKLNISTLILENIIRKYSKDHSFRKSVSESIKREVSELTIESTTKELTNDQINYLLMKYIDLSKILKYKETFKYILESNLVYIPIIVKRVEEETLADSFSNGNGLIDIISKEDYAKNTLIETISEELETDDNIIDIYSAFYILDLMSLIDKDGYCIDYKTISNFIKSDYRFNKSLEYLNTIVPHLYSEINKSIKKYINNFNDFYNYIEKLDLDNINTSCDLYNKYEEELLNISNNESNVNVSLYVQNIMIHIIFKTLKNK